MMKIDVEAVLIYGWILDLENNLENYIELLELEGIDREKIDDLDGLLEGYIKEKYDMDFGYINPSFDCDVEERVYYLSYPEVGSKEGMKTALDEEISEKLIDLLVNLGEIDFEPEIFVLNHFPDIEDKENKDDKTDNYFGKLCEYWLDGPAII